MYQILEKKTLNANTKLMVIEAPHVARKAEPGQFIILRVTEDGERIPLTIAEYDREKGTITIIFQEVGATTMALGQLNVGDCLHDFVGPLGKASELEGLKKVAVVGGGLGCAIAYPQAKKLHEMGCEVDLIAGFRNKDIIILEDEMKAASTNLYVVTDDGSNGRKALVTEVLKELIEAGNQYDAVIAIGPMIMMKFVAETTRPYGIKTIVSMNTIMVDGTGMCGGCRLTVGGETKFACVDGPDFDGHLVDFDGSMRRSAMYKAQEKASVERHECNLMKQEVK
ncbi:sulfide/dihydroorotate dehydrogenase-like FAD/NAD-binding protein [Agathobaculum sp. NSJ-28]|mgnify:FL=1|uniref:Sulfide/dihydroorotate dehydrogenase-like FAD/NAD-binding protein n=2 Tax=Agathobaculum TaxID=2048137 RepID=A0A923LTU0_9FIRM|nr:MULTISPECIES: sulfide/dihydroorotate dehydrogenase-like FAD/NAD-binding protein [Butyricicoccaceae]MBC5724030.1 sulfide/dihydroorotate dehydrogenase-like FAD/NAD-binding protein [Agathobaculum faecis]MBS6882110.1 sulfide/dihydroorotate dehydrogenase-like FAD/NAD-binding protein [Clostridiaceae bacterium]SCI41935.1 Dihydrdoorotate oxidase B%2C electron transfer subunit [uncultured Butyricicoccus sp.]MCU6787663.1 sulfide/dihydroorotate dehydrogenase-like FAD/NAD-binding protein [Agathobaculum 